MCEYQKARKRGKMTEIERLSVIKIEDIDRQRERQKEKYFLNVSSLCKY